MSEKEIQLLLELLNINYLNLKAEEQLLGEQLDALKARLDQIAEKLASYESVVAHTKSLADDAEDDEDVFGPIFEKVETRARPALEDAIVHIAEENGGIFNSYTDKEYLIELGLLRGEPNVMAQKLYKTLDDSEWFEKNGEKGRWRLVTEDEDEDEDETEDDSIF